MSSRRPIRAAAPVRFVPEHDEEMDNADEKYVFKSVMARFNRLSYALYLVSLTHNSMADVISLVQQFQSQSKPFICVHIVH